MLLSLEHAASGANLTAASHVIFVHPMNAETVPMAVSYEQQAIARVRPCVAGVFTSTVKHTNSNVARLDFK